MDNLKEIIPPVGISNKILLDWIESVWEKWIMVSYKSAHRPFKSKGEALEYRKRFLIYIFLVHQRMLKHQSKHFLYLAEKIFNTNLEKYVMSHFSGTFILDVRYIENFQAGKSQQLLDLIKMALNNLFPDEDGIIRLTTNEIVPGFENLNTLGEVVFI